MARSEWDNARLRRLKRVAGRVGLSVLMNAKPDPRRDGPGYMVTREHDRQVLLGDKPAPYSASLDAVEAFVEAYEPTDET